MNALSVVSDRSAAFVTSTVTVSPAASVAGTTLMSVTGVLGGTVTV